MTMESIYSIQKRKLMSHKFMTSMQILTYLLMMVKFFIQKYYVPILLSKINEDVSSGSEFDSAK